MQNKKKQRQNHQNRRNNNCREQKDYEKMSVLATMSSLSASKLDDTRIHPRRSAIKQISQRFAEVISNGVCSACNGYYGEFFLY